MKKILFRIFLVTIFITAALYASEVTHLYSTWDTLELDTCVSAWLIKRFVDKEAQFKFYPKGELIKEGIPFDTPDAELRRRHGLSCFESIVQKYNITDPAVLKIAEMIHQIEISYWTQPSIKDAKLVDQKVENIISNSTSPQDALDKSFKIFDELYEKLEPNSD